MIRLKQALMERSDNSFEHRLKLLKHSLQTAIELEHATIPPYLYALYSIKTAENLEIAHLIKSIVKQEMLHMSLDCNVLNAIGGHPKIDHPRFIPHYPGTLPGSVEDSLIVPLAALSKQLVSDVFMVIEEPEQTVDGDASPPDGVTIGEFYQHIIDEITELSKMGNIFTGNPERQLVTGFAELQNQGVYDENTATNALKLIIDQGEGSTSSPIDTEHELAHYYKFAEIYHGRKLIPNPTPEAGQPEWLFEGHRIVFDPCGVYPVISNPNRHSYESQPRVEDLNRTFNRTYSDMLRKLHHVFNGQPDKLALSLLSMQSLREQAQLLMTQEVVPGQTAGPTFDYIPA
ncbi:ferritin-like domain-containing protein [Undibacterium sp. JH2W]|uniref:ferritin-like domain-containing protein n=1 Tax=Undibacterium sp. JH2W TaxID=3413037 RepID=UPI003BF511AE